MKKETGKVKKEKKAENNKLFYAVFLFVFAFLLYGNTFTNGYNLDDELVTRNHPLTSQGIKAIPEIITSPYFKGSGITYEYRPVVLISFAIEHQFFGESPQTSHFFNVLLYALSVVLLFLTLKKVLSSYHIFLPFAITLLFTAHPLHTEVVASIKNRDEILALLFALLSVYTAFSFVHKKEIRYLFFSISAFILAVLSKSSVIPFACILPVALFFFSNATMRQIFIVSLSLSLVSGLMAPFYNFSYKVLFVFFLTGSPFLLNMLLNQRKLLVKTGENIKTLFNNGAYDSSGMRTFSKGELWLFISVSVLLCVVGVFYNFRLLIFIALAMLIILYYVSDKLSKEFIFGTFIFVVSLVSINYKQSHILAFCLVLILFLFLFVEKQRKKYLIISLLFLFIPWVLWAKYEGIFWILYLTFLMWGVSVKKYRNYAFALIAVFFISSPLVSYIRNTSMLNSGHFFSVAALSITLFIYFKLKNQKLALLFLILLIPVALSIKLSTMTGSYSIIVEKYFNPATSIAIGSEILPASGRHLDLVEMPLTVHDPFALKIGTGFYVMAEYLKKLIFPLNMGFYYGYKYIEPQNWNHPQSLISLFIHLVLIVMSLLFYKKEKLIFFAVFFYLATISLFSNVVVPLPGLMADRFTYLPSLGFSILIGILFFMILKINYHSAYIDLKKHKISVILFSLIISLYSFRTISRNQDWENHLTLFRSDIAHLDNAAQAHNLLATNLIIYSHKEKNASKSVALKEEAVGHYRKALDIYPEFFNAAYDLGRTYYQLMNYDSALFCFNKAITLNPLFYDSYLQSAFIYHQKDSINRAVEYYYKTIDLKKDIPNVYKNLTAIYFTQNDFEKVIEINQKYKIQAPETKEPIINIAKAYFINEQYDSASLYFKEIIALDPNDIDAIKALIEIYTKTNNKTELAFYTKKFAEVSNKLR